MSQSFHGIATFLSSECPEPQILIWNPGNGVVEVYIELDDPAFCSLCHKRKAQFLLKPDVPLPHMILSFLQWRDRKLNSGPYDVLLNVIQGESRWYCNDEHTLTNVYSVSCLARHLFSQPPLRQLLLFPWCLLSGIGLSPGWDVQPKVAEFMTATAERRLWCISHSW